MKELMNHTTNMEQAQNSVVQNLQQLATHQDFEQLVSAIDQLPYTADSSQAIELLEGVESRLRLGDTLHASQQNLHQLYDDRPDAVKPDASEDDALSQPMAALHGVGKFEDSVKQYLENLTKETASFYPKHEPTTQTDGDEEKAKQDNLNRVKDTLTKEKYQSYVGLMIAKLGEADKQWVYETAQAVRDDVVTALWEAVTSGREFGSDIQRQVALDELHDSLQAWRSDTDQGFDTANKALESAMRFLVLDK